MQPTKIRSVYNYFLLAILLSNSGLADTRRRLPQIPYNGELRLRLEDPVQEKRTTSLNWLDLPSGVTSVDGTKVASLAPGKLATPPVLPPRPYAKATIRPKARPVRIVVDAGHGGHDWGAGGHFGLLEKEVSLKTSFLVQRQLERLGKLRDIPIEVRMTRTDDKFVSLKSRVEQANNWRADIFISVHANSAASKKLSGFEVYFQSPEATDDHSSRVAYVENQSSGKKVESDVLNILKDAQASIQIEQSSDLAERVYSTMSKYLKPNVRGVRQAPFTVLSGAEMPALLIEVGYVTHKGDAENLNKLPYLKRIAGAISSGVFEFIAQLGV